MYIYVLYMCSHFLPKIIWIIWIYLYWILLLAFPLSRNPSPRPIGFSPYFNLTKYHSWILLVESCPTTITILKFQFCIESYGISKFSKFSLTFSTSLPHGFHMVHSHLFHLTWCLCVVMMWHTPPSLIIAIFFPNSSCHPSDHIL